MKTIKSLLKESLTYELIETLMGEEYPQSFNMEEFKQLPSFNARIKYCQEHLNRISSGSSRIVYMIDNEKVLKLAKNKKGLAQNEVEYEQSGEGYLEDTVARVFDVDENFYWIEMELARKLTPKIFHEITGFQWKDFVALMHNHGIDASNDPRAKRMGKLPIDPEIASEMWEDTFVYDLLNYIANYDVAFGDLLRLNSYGVV